MNNSNLIISNPTDILVESKVHRMIIDKLGLPEKELNPDADFINDIGADSLDLVELIVGIEKKFNITIPDEQVERIKTVNQLTAYVKANVK